MEIDFTDAEDSNLKESKITTCRPFTMNILTENINPPEDVLQGKTSAEQDILRKNWVSIKHYNRRCISIHFQNYFLCDFYYITNSSV